MRTASSNYLRPVFAITLALLFNQGLLAAESPPIGDFSQCTYKAGKDAGDLDKATAYWQQQMAKIYPEGGSYLGVIYTPIWGSGESDFVWGGFAPNLNDWATGTTEYLSHKEAEVANARFEAVADCTPANAYVVSQLHQGAEPKPDDNDSIIEVFACTLHDGKTMTNAMAAEKAWNAQAKAMGYPVSSWRFTPAWANTQVDLMYMVAHDDLPAFGANNTNWMGYAGSGAINTGFAAAMSCESFVMSAKIVSRPAPGSWPE
jgi:hypothetical protein